MIGLVLVTHGRLAEEFVAAMQHVVGPQTQISAVCIEADDDIDDDHHVRPRGHPALRAAHDSW